MAQREDTPSACVLEEAITVPFCEIDDAYRILNPRGSRYAALKKLSDSEVMTLSLFQQLRGVESERSFLRDAQGFFSHPFPGVVGLAPSFLVSPAGEEAAALFGTPETRGFARVGGRDPETLIVDSTLLPVLHPRQVKQSAGLEGAACG